MKKLLQILSLCVIIVFISACSILPGEGSIPVQLVNNADQRIINVTGNGIVTTTPDIGYLHIGVHTENVDSGDAVNENNNLTRNVKNALKEYGVEDKDIQTSNFSIYLQSPYSGFPEEQSKTIVDNTVLVTVRNLNDLSKMLGEAIRSGANNVYGMTFDVTDKSSYREQARTLAMEDAATQAAQLASLAGGEPGKVISVTVVTNTNFSPYYGDGMGGGGGVVNNTNVPVSAGNMTISVDVNVIYELIN
jgi:uncharacterized protein YggE